MFRIAQPAADNLTAFHQDGYVVFPAVLQAEGITGLTDEILDLDQVKVFFSLPDDKRRELPRGYRLGVKPFNQKGPWSRQLFDAPLVTSLLTATIGPAVHFCHSSLHISLRGAPSIKFHQDHHHWRHGNPVNLAEREKWYVQMLYYPNGFQRGDAGLRVIPGSHRVSPTEDVTPARLLGGAYDAQAGRRLEAVDLELPPGSMVFLNARMFHGVTAKPLDSPQACRIFVNYIFKQAGPPHRHTQLIPSDWPVAASARRKKLFEREPYADGCWT